MPISPKIDQMMQMPGQDQEQQIFEQSFSEMAQGLLVNKLPEVANDVATFKIVDSDLDTGSAVGAFIVQRGETSLYIPVVLVENQLKPLEVMYSQTHDAFLPLSSEWLSEIERGALEPLGESTKTPESLYSDVDIRNLIVPPTTGRYSFASAPEIEKAEKWIEGKAKAGSRAVSKAALKLPEALKKTTNKLKKKFASLLEQDPSLLKVAVAIYGSQELLSALAPTAEKTAAKTEVTSTEELAIATRKTPAQEVKSVFGPHSAEAMQGIALKGYAAKDTRKNLNKAIDEETPMKLQQVTQPGAYKLFKKDGSTVKAYIRELVHTGESDFALDDHLGAKKLKKGVRHDLGVLSEDGVFYSVDSDLYGEPIPEGDLTGAVKAALTGKASPKTGKGIFVRNNGGVVEFTKPFEISSVTTGGDGVTRCKAKQSWSDFTIVMNKEGENARLFAPKGSGLVVVPASYKWVTVTEDENRWENPFVKDPARLGMAYMNLLKLNGGESVSVKKASTDDYLIGGTSFTGTRVDTVIKLARDYRLSINDAEQVVKVADDRGRARVMVASLAALTKLAEGDKKPPQHKKKTTVTEEPAADPNSQPPEGDPGMDPGMEGGDPGMDPGMDPAAGGDPGMDPAAAGMDPSQMAPPSPTDQAVQELQEEVTRAHEEHMKLLQHKIDALQMVAQRTQEITQGIPKEQSTAIQQAVSTASQGAPQAGAPSPEGDQGAAPPPGGAPQGAGAPMDPNAPMDPSLMQEASGLADPKMFDAAAIGTLAEHGSVKDLVGTYMPTLEKSVDHVGRILLTLWIKGADLRAQMGEQNYTALEDKLRNVFRGLGEVVLRLNRDSLIMEEGEQGQGNGAAGL